MLDPGAEPSHLTLLSQGLSAPTPSSIFSIQHILLPYENNQLIAEGFS